MYEYHTRRQYFPGSMDIHHIFNKEKSNNTMTGNYLRHMIIIREFDKFSINNYTKSQKKKKIEKGNISIETGKQV